MQMVSEKVKKQNCLCSRNSHALQCGMIFLQKPPQPSQFGGKDRTNENTLRYTRFSYITRNTHLKQIHIRLCFLCNLQCSNPNTVHHMMNPAFTFNTSSVFTVKVWIWSIAEGQPYFVFNVVFQKYNNKIFILSRNFFLAFEHLC